jgi:hypothetical protein
VIHNRRPLLTRGVQQRETELNRDRKGVGVYTESGIDYD